MFPLSLTVFWSKWAVALDLLALVAMVFDVPRLMFVAQQMSKSIAISATQTSATA
ncbi:MAG: hypothetical protein KA914_07045 [Ottowia sp.]|nr:hypothetical protein [Ottowia sp.]